jgi:hypothetical protein
MTNFPGISHTVVLITWLPRSPKSVGQQPPIPCGLILLGFTLCIVSPACLYSLLPIMPRAVPPRFPLSRRHRSWNTLSPKTRKNRKTHEIDKKAINVLLLQLHAVRLSFWRRDPLLFGTFSLSFAALHCGWNTLPDSFFAFAARFIFFIFSSPSACCCSVPFK